MRLWPLIGKDGENTLRYIVVGIPAAWLGVLGKDVAQRTGPARVEFARQTDTQIVPRIVQSQRDSSDGVVFPVAGA